MLILHLASNLILLAEARNRRADRQARERIERLPAITVAATANHYKSFTAPNPDYKATIRRPTGDRIGTAAYALSPLDDRVYLFRVEIEAAHRRQGYGLALLWYLARTYERPITPVHQAIGSYEFWSAARQLEAAGLVVTGDVRISEMDDEASRWGHLRPQAERLQQQISERLSRHEPWDVAVGRGLESDG
jgi:hypothetical protein